MRAPTNGRAVATGAGPAPTCHAGHGPRSVSISTAAPGASALTTDGAGAKPGDKSDDVIDAEYVDADDKKKE